MEKDIERIIESERIKLESNGEWTEITRYNFANVPTARIKHGRVMSNGQHEQAIGYIAVWSDGEVTKHYNL